MYLSLQRIVFAQGKSFCKLNSLRICYFEKLKIYLVFFFSVSGRVCCDGFALNSSTGLCQSKCDKIYRLKFIDNVRYLNTCIVYNHLD